MKFPKKKHLNANIKQQKTPINNNITFIDLSLGLEDKNSKNLYYMYPWDNHLNPAGHKKVADQLEFELKRLIY